LEERNSFFIRGIWGLNVGDSAFNIRFSPDSFFIIDAKTNRMIMNDKYEIQNDNISLSNGQDFRLAIKRILTLTLMVEYEDSTLYARRMSC